MSAMETRSRLSIHSFLDHTFRTVPQSSSSWKVIPAYLIETAVWNNYGPSSKVSNRNLSRSTLLIALSPQLIQLISILFTLGRQNLFISTFRIETSSFRIEHNHSRSQFQSTQESSGNGMARSRTSSASACAASGGVRCSARARPVPIRWSKIGCSIQSRCLASTISSSCLHKVWAPTWRWSRSPLVSMVESIHE